MYGDSGSLSEETDKVETQLAVQCKRDTKRDHEDYKGQFEEGPVLVHFVEEVGQE